MAQPNPAAPVPKTDTLLTRPMTRFEALQEVGVFQPVDTLFAVLLPVSGLGALLWLILKGSGLGLLIVCLLLLLAAVAWLVALVFRCMDFLVTMQASIHLLPETAANIVLNQRLNA